ncbi:MAG: DUF4945 domain-containing protein [Proteiniphilum sp.]|jgi:hypothetical protein|nr:DUF4945 domain-containing protein [Proteiniphilum sp.]MDD2936829.1 DUF4945 domain-containing protein [Proteiniphilum sp.]MDD3075408.1 DUF4945 domain-containing protein [Proteiniphilum sp.]MDD3779665.1 DUF4945 domain-containing protein [Proteiniphilum sp.]MDD3954943.1 DUF4945 domain-containing protein [Proteiniphilum sp.]
MKKIEKLIIAALALILFTGCYDRDIIDRKDFNHSLPKVENLSYTQQGNVITLSWQISDNIPEDFKRPLEASIQVVENGIYRQKVSVLNEVKSANITINPDKEYRFIVKLLGFLTAEAKEEGFTDRVFSEGAVIEIKE